MTTTFDRILVSGETRGTAGTSMLPVMASQAESSGRVRALVLLAGTVRPTTFDQAIGRSPLDLPVTDELSILDSWVERAGELRTVWCELRLRVVSSGGPSVSRTNRRPDWMSIEEDPRAFRGTAGLLKDLVSDYEADDVVLVSPGRRLVTSSLVKAANSVGDEEVTIFANGREDTGLMAVRVGALRRVKDVGFEDFREQFLPRLVDDRGRAVIRDSKDLQSWPIRSVGDYIAAVRAAQRLSTNQAGGAGEDADEEEWRPSFSIVERGAVMEAGATAHDSVVLSGAKVGAKAILGRCLIGEGGVVPAGARLLDELVLGRV